MLSVTNITIIGLAIILLILSSQKAKYYIKATIFLIVGSTLPFIVILLAMLNPYGYGYRNGWIPSYILVGLGELLGASFELRGLENVDVKKGGVVVVNHQSGPDFALVSKFYTRIGPFIMVTAKDLIYKCPPIYFLILLLGGISIDLSDKESAKMVMNKQVNLIKNKNYKLLVFPEGKRNETSKLLAFKKGSFHVGILSQTFIQPIVASKYNFFDSKNKFFGRGRCIIQILPRISTVGMSVDDLDELVEKTRDLMQNEFTKLNNEVKNN